MNTIYELFNPATHPIADENMADHRFSVDSTNTGLSTGTTGTSSSSSSSSTKQVTNNLSCTDYFNTFRKEFVVAHDFLGIIHEEHR